MSFLPWVEKLQREIADDTSFGIDVRLEAIVKTATTSAQRLLDQKDIPDTIDGSKVLAASVLFESIGSVDLLLSATNRRPVAVVLDIPTPDFDIDSSSLSDGLAQRAKRVAQWQPRAAYTVPPELLTELPLDDIIRHEEHGMKRKLFTQEIQCSHETAGLLTETHRALGKHTHAVGSAVADLFQHCERMLGEFQDQLNTLQEVRFIVKDIVGNDNERGRGEKGVRERVEQAQSKQADLVCRYEALQKKEAILAARLISEKEEAWRREVRQLQFNILGPEEGDEETKNSKATIRQRYEEVRIPALNPCSLLQP